MRPPDELLVGPLLLRRFGCDDFAPVTAVLRENVTHLADWLAWSTLDNAELSVQRRRWREIHDAWDAASAHTYLCWLADEIVGSFGLHRRIGPGGMEIGYWVARRHVDRGYGTACVRALTAVARALPDVQRVEIHCDETNQAGAAIPRKLGYRLDRVQYRTPVARLDTQRLQIWVTS